MVKRTPLPSCEKLHELLRYDAERGILCWRDRRLGVNANMVAGIATHRGYIVVRIGGTLYAAHRVIWKLMTGSEPPTHIDHIDTNRSNNAWSNLREADNSKNMMNSPVSRQNTSGAKGVSWHKKAKKWMVSVKRDGRIHYGGLFFEFSDAVAAMELLRLGLHGEFARAA